MSQTPDPSPRHPVNARSVCVGLLGVIYLCALAPLNDYLLRNGVMIGGSLPVGIVLFFIVLHLLVVGPLSRWFPKSALTRGELITVLVMMLVACVIPTTGLMRFWPATVVGPWFHATGNDRFHELLTMLDLPWWYWPAFEGEDSRQWPNDPLVRLFYSGQLPPDASILPILRAWVPPMLGWGVFFAALACCLLGLSFICGKQWIVNERVAFPIAQVQQQLVDTPKPGRFFNELLSTRSFWIAASLVILLRANFMLGQYVPNVPVIEPSYNLRALFTEAPLSSVEGHVTLQTIWPIVIAITFFVSARISFSLWAFILLWQPPTVLMDSYAAKPTGEQLRFFQLGCVLSFLGMIGWTGRHHYLGVIRTMFMPGPPGGERAEFVHDRLAGWMVVGGFLTAMAWLMVCGAPWYGALFLLLGLLGVWIVLANVVAHGGLLQPTIIAGAREWSLPFFANTDARTNYLAGHVFTQYHLQSVGGMFATASDQLLVYSTHGEKVARDSRLNFGRRLLPAIVLALVVGYFTAATVSLNAYYRHNFTLDASAQSPINKEVLEGQPLWTLTHTQRTHEVGGYNPRAAATRPWWPWLVGGSVGTAALAYLQLTLAWWPLHPIGLLMSLSYPVRRIWFSIFLGWLLKVLIVRFGGSSLFTLARPFFTGIIVGDVLAAALAGLINVGLLTMGFEFTSIDFLPTSQF